MRRRTSTGIAPPLAPYLTAALLIRLADEGARIALLLTAAQRTGNPRDGGLLVGAFLLPHVVSAPIVGRIVDRSRHRPRLHAIGFVIFGCALAMACTVLGRAPFGVAIALTVIAGCVGPLSTGGMTSMIGRLLPEADRDRGYGLDILTYNLAGIVGPAIIAAISGWLGTWPSAWLLLIWAAGAGVMVLRIPAATVQHNESGNAAPSIWAGVVVFGANRRLLAATLANCLATAGLAGLPVAIVAMGQESWSPGWMPVAVSATAIGGLVGAAVYARYPFGTGSPDRTNLVCLAAVMAPLGILLTPVPVSIAVLALVVSGFWIGPMSSSVFLVRDRTAPLEMKTEIFTLAAGVKMACGATGAALAGLLTQAGHELIVGFVLGALLAGLAAGWAILGTIADRPATAGVRSRRWRGP